MHRLSSLIAALVLLAGAAEAGPYQPPRLRSGVPDLQGFWTNTSVTMLQRSPQVKTLVLSEPAGAAMEAGFTKFVTDILGGAGPVDPQAPAPKVTDEVPNADWLEMDMHLARVRGEIRSSWIIDPADGRLPFTDAGRKAAHEVGVRSDTDFTGPEARPTEERCLTAIGSPEGPPMLNTGFNGNYQIVQTRDQVAILVEMDHDVRIVRLGDRTHPAPAVTSWLGDSVGWWDGDTLVVETTNLNPKGGVWSLGGGFLYTAQTRITERFTRTAADGILYEFKVEDPWTFTRPWRGEMPMRAAKGPIYEYACHEGNYSLPNILSGSRASEARK